MLEKGLKLVFPIIIGLMAFAISYVHFVEVLHLNAILGLAIAVVIAILTSSLYLFSIFVLPKFLLIMGKGIKRLLCQHHDHKNICPDESANIANIEDYPTANIEDGPTIEDSINKWEKAKEEFISYTQQEIFSFFPEQHHPSLLQIIEDFASNNIACSSPIKCTLKETEGLSAGDICHFIGNLVLKFKQADKNKVMNRHAACNFAKNAFPNIITQAPSYVYSHLVQYEEFGKIRNFKKEEL